MTNRTSYLAILALLVSAAASSTASGQEFFARASTGSLMAVPAEYRDFGWLDYVALTAASVGDPGRLDDVAVLNAYPLSAFYESANVAALGNLFADAKVTLLRVTPSGYQLIPHEAARGAICPECEDEDGRWHARRFGTAIFHLEGKGYLLASAEGELAGIRPSGKVISWDWNSGAFYNPPR